MVAEPQKIIGRLMLVTAVLLIGYAIASLMKEANSVNAVKQSTTAVPEAPAQPQQAVIPPQQPESPQPVELPFSGIAVTPYQIMKNPFVYTGKLVRLDFESVPIVEDGTVSQYVKCNAPICEKSGRSGIAFNRMLTRKEAIYDVRAIDGGMGGGEMEKLGELIVELDVGGSEPSMTQDWLVTTEEPTQGTNSLGGPISVPTIRFVRFASSEESMRTGGLTNPYKQQ